MCLVLSVGYIVDCCTQMVLGFCCFLLWCTLIVADVAGVFCVVYLIVGFAILVDIHGLLWLVVFLLFCSSGQCGFVNAPIWTVGVS